MGVTRGHADQIVYDVKEGTVRLTNDAWVSLSGGSNDITSQQIVYDIRSERVQATSPGTQGVHITLSPQSTSKQGRKPDKAAPAAPAGPPPPPPPPLPTIHSIGGEPNNRNLPPDRPASHRLRIFVHVILIPWSISL
jgi:hypothetical protein